MHNQELLIVFEKMYLQENEIKEKITIRVQILFTLIVALVAASSYMLRMLDFGEFREVAILIASLVVVFLALLLVAVVYAVNAFWGNTFKQTPPASEIKSYCNALVSYNAEVEQAKATSGYEGELVDVKSDLDAYLTDIFEECATNNAEVNFQRSVRAHQSFKWLLFSLVPLSLAAIMFIGFDMDVSSPRKNYQVIDRYVGDQLGKIEKKLESVDVLANKFKEELVATMKTGSVGNQSEAKQTSTPEAEKAQPIEVAPQKPTRPPVRISLEDFSSQTVGPDHDIEK